jgi:hypothetical protein
MAWNLLTSTLFGVKKEAKIWLSPFALQHNHGYTQRELREVLRLAAANAASFLEAWDDYFANLNS